ncbi:MAG: peptidoglycan-binding domain-containing protein, partial [Primorskyibacter sp.]
MTGLRAVLAIAVAVLMLARGAMAQDVAYIQIEAQPSLARAETRLRAYTSTLEDVNGFALGAGWYGIALGPYPRDTAERRLDALVLQGLIPRDSYIAPPNEYRDRFWPIGAQPTVLIPAEDPLTPPVAPTPDLTTPAVTQPTPQPVPQPEPQPDPGETRAEARASERQLTRSDREGLQIVLKWAGHYRSSIDAAFGPGTRRAMRAWQEANAY